MYLTNVKPVLCTMQISIQGLPGLLHPLPISLGECHQATIKKLVKRVAQRCYIVILHPPRLMHDKDRVKWTTAQALPAPERGCIYP
jgi:hypothetical protein